ncbi:SseB family protein [Lachnotalea glycerini]|uniref:SseB family protein n=1 Tax=Lachnotalea glycerini TaxID=1763509 RepID=A0A371JBU6_9FIRM|nr:SseB family protein [Lachnotalea glycerini]RDY30136.1 SseB family protein [Lachnotalea glycerini]
MSVKINEEEKKEYIEYMLQNNTIEENLKNWKQNQNSEVLSKMLETIAAKSEECAGLILSVKSDSIPTGADNIALFSDFDGGVIHRVIDNEGKSYAMLFTSKEKFKECDDTSGIVMFIDEVFELIVDKEELDGMVMNIYKEDVVFNKFVMRVVIWLIRQASDKGKCTEVAEN